MIDQVMGGDDHNPKLKWVVMTDVPATTTPPFDLVGRTSPAGRGAKTAFIEDAGKLHHAQLAEASTRRQRPGALGIGASSASAIGMLDAATGRPVLGAIKAGSVPVAMNPCYAGRLRNTSYATARAALFVSDPLLKNFEPILRTALS